MTADTYRCRPVPEDVPAPQSNRGRSGGVTGIHGDGVWAQLTRFAVVGGSSNFIYAGVFVLLGAIGTFGANITGVLVSTAMANELHRRLTFRASDRVTWFAAQWEGGALALVGIALSSVSLLMLHLYFPGSSHLVQVLVVITVSALTGAMRFVILRGLFTHVRIFQG